jgi:hypothetical protein
LQSRDVISEDASTRSWLVMLHERPTLVSDKSNSVGAFGTIVIPTWVANRDGHFTFNRRCIRDCFRSTSSQAGPCVLDMQSEA